MKTVTTWSSLVLFSILIAMLSIGCTGQIPGSFRFLQQEEYFNSTVSVNTKLDMLWVVDNSPSMDSSQVKIRDGFASFAERYMKPTWDIRVAVISQDTYLAHPSFANHLNGVDNGWFSRPAGYQSTYLDPSSGANPKRTTPFVTPAWWIGSSISANGTVQGAGAKVRLVQPDYGGYDISLPVSVTNPSAWARLIPGRHDGPLTTICWTSSSNHFFFGSAQCHVRDKQDVYSGTDGCVTGGTGDDASTVQCANTLMNNTVRSGNPIISTQPPDGVEADAAWTDGLYRDFLVNLSGGVSGLGLEKPFNSIQQLIADNETALSQTKFFRPDALRVIIIVTDEDDQSMNFPSAQITPTGFGYNSGAGCPWKTHDGHTYRLQICPKAADSISIPAFKDELDEFFRALDGSDPGEGDPNYFFVTITPQTGQAIKDIHDSLGEDAGGYNSASADYATRMFELLDSVGNGSMKLELSSADYTPLLDSIGQAVVQKKAVFKLTRAPTAQEEMSVQIRHKDGTFTLVPATKYTIDGKLITITDLDVVLGLASTDTIAINYQPKTFY